MRIEFPSHIRSDINGYSFFVDLFYQVKNLRRETIVLDFKNCVWFEANLCAILGAILSGAAENFCGVKFENVSSSVNTILTKNHFLSHFGGMVLPDTHATTIKYRKFKISEEKQFKDYLDNELLSQQDLPKMSPLLKIKISKSIFEIFNNAVIHGQCSNVFSCGQYYPNKKRLDFTIADLGKTIRSNVNRYLNKTFEGSAAIQWAVEEGHTTKTGNIPGGLGLSLIRDFLKLNQGEMQIISSNGFWQETKGNTFAHDFNHRFVGTIVNLEFNINDHNSYILSSEIDPDQIF